MASHLLSHMTLFSLCHLRAHKKFSNKTFKGQQVKDKGFPATKSRYHLIRDQVINEKFRERLRFLFYKTLRLSVKLGLLETYNET